MVDVYYILTIVLFWSLLAFGFAVLLYRGEGD